MKYILTLLYIFIFIGSTFSQTFVSNGKLIPSSGHITFKNGDYCAYDVMYLDKDSLFVKFENDSSFIGMNKGQVDWFRYENDNKIEYFNVNGNLKMMRIKKENNGFTIKKGDRSLITGLSIALLGGLAQSLSAVFNDKDLSNGLKISSGALLVVGTTISLDGIVKRNKHYKWKMRTTI